MTSVSGDGPSLLSAPSFLAETIATSCRASGATIVATTPRREIGRWPSRLPAHASSAEFELGTEYSIVIYDGGEEPTPPLLRLARHAIDAWNQNETLRCETIRLLRQTRTTLEVSREICSLRELDQLLLLVAERSRDLLHCELAGFALLDDKGSWIVWPAMSGARTDTYLHTVFPADGGVAGLAMSTRKPVIVEDFLLDDTLTPASNPISFAEGLRSALAVPLDIADRPRGCLMIGYREPHAFSDEEIDILSSFASQAAIAVENAELYDRVSRERARMQSVVESMDEGLILIDTEGYIAHVNRRAEDLFEYSRDEMLGLTFNDFLMRLGKHSDEPDLLRTRIASLPDVGGRFPACDVTLREPQAIDLRVTSFDVYDRGGTTLGRGLLFRDVTAERHVDALKSDVIAIVSHEIRSPLSSIRGCASALLDTERKRSKRLKREYLQTIDRESTRLNDLVSALTDVSRLDAGVLNMEFHNSDPIVLIERVVARKRALRPISLTFEHPGAPLRFDHRRIEQVLENLLDNALKYSDSTSEIHVRVADFADEFVVTIVDRGIGIPRQLHERVFERFFRVAGTQGNDASSGLGLYICRGIIEAHGGRISLDSTHGEGTTVSFSLPRFDER